MTFKKEKKWYEIENKIERQLVATKKIQELAPDYEKFEELYEYCKNLKDYIEVKSTMDALKFLFEKDKKKK